MTRGRVGIGPFARKTVLPNGVRVLTEKMERVDSVSLGLWSLSGSCSDPEGGEGMTHFLEHMVFKGTRARSTRQIAEAIDDIGGYVNGVTEREEMHLYARTGWDQADTALRLLFDLILNSVCNEEDVGRERAVILQEIAHLDDVAEDLMHELVPQTVWPGHCLGRPLMGTREGIEGLKPRALREFLRDDVQASDRLMVIAAGRVDHDQVVDVVAGLAGHLKAGRERKRIEAPSFHSHRRLISQDGAQVHFCLVAPGITLRDERRHAFAVLDGVLGGGTSSRLFQEIRDNRGLVYEIGSYLQAYREAGAFVIAAGTSPANFGQVVDLVEQEVAGLRREGPSLEELERAKVQIKVSLALAAEGTGYRMNHLALSEIHWGRVLSFEEIVRGVDAVTVEDVHELAESLLGEDQRALVAIGPFEGEGEAR